jgi:hypothetical protein
LTYDSYLATCFPLSKKAELQISEQQARGEFSAEGHATTGPSINPLALEKELYAVHIIPEQAGVYYGMSLEELQATWQDWEDVVTEWRDPNHVLVVQGTYETSLQLTKWFQPHRGHAEFNRYAPSVVPRPTVFFFRCCAIDVRYCCVFGYPYNYA